MRSAWSNVLEAAAAVRTRLEVSMVDHWQGPYRSPSDTHIAPNLIKLNLAVPPELQLSAAELKLSSVAGGRIILAFEKAIQGLRVACIAKFDEVCLQLSALPSSSKLSTKDELQIKLAESYEALFRRQVGSWRDEVLRLSHARTLQDHLQSPNYFVSDEADQSPAFNHVCTVLLY